MLFEAMPLSLHTNKRKGQHVDDNLPLQKRLAVEGKVAGKNGQPAFPVDLRETEEESPLPNYLGHIQTPEKQKAVIPKSSSIVRSLPMDTATVVHLFSENGRDVNCSGNMLSESEDSDESSVCESDDSLDVGSGMDPGSPPDKQSYSMKQPSLILKDVKKNPEDRSRAFSSKEKLEISQPLLYETGGYMRRMASLNASARVSAMMEPEKKFRPNKWSQKPTGKTHGLRPRRSSSPSSNDESTYPTRLSLMTSPRHAHTTLSPRRPHNLSSSSFSSTSESDTSRELEDILDSSATPQVCTLLALATLAASRAAESDLDQIPFNTLGLLYNGDTVHSSARVFYTSDTDLALPHRIIPTIVPSRDEFVDLAVRDALALRGVNQRRKLKAAKANNGWMTLGNPIKTIEYYNGSSLVARRYYAGITRNHAKEIVFIRDSVLIRAGGSKEEKPYVAKIASIWREQPGHLMMTVFWYYRPYELDGLATQGISFQKDELLASQHHDDNSVACIEEKCYILGTAQYCRYQAYIQSKRDKCVPRSLTTIPSLNRSHNQQQPRHTKEQDSDLISRPLEVLRGQDFESLMKVGPELVYLCTKGYNHCAAKLTSKTFLK